MPDEAPLETTRQFWDANPCGVHDASYELVRAQRYAMEPWIPGLLSRIASRHSSILEVGCGQGVDSIGLCSTMREGARYIGIDYSPMSIEAATANAAQNAARLRVKPSYRVGNAEALAFPDAEFEAVYSLGVIHHTADEARAVREVYRVLKPGGTAYICLYRKWMPKVAIAKLLRGLQRVLDAGLGTDRCIYRLLSRRGSHSKLFGTMFHECFGVPYMKWYSRTGIDRLFAQFAGVRMTHYGTNLGRVRPSSAPARLGYLWLIEATKSS